MMLTVGESVDRYWKGRWERRELRPQTVRCYREQFSSMLDYVGADTPIRRVTPEVLEGWVAKIAVSIAPGTLNLRVATAHLFWHWAVRSELVVKDPMRMIQTPSRPSGVPRTLTDAAVTDLLHAVSERRELVCVSLMLREGLRCGEVAGMNLADVDLAAKTMVVRMGKGGRQRALPVTSHTIGAVHSYLLDRGRDAGRLVRPKNGRFKLAHDGVLPVTVGRIVADLMERAGVDESAHALRHTFARDMLEAGASLRDLQTALGHASIATTQIYMPFTNVVSLRAYMGRKDYEHPVLDVAS